MARSALGWEPKNMKLAREHSARAAENTGAATVIPASDISPEKMAAILAGSRPVKASGPLRPPKAAVVRQVLAEDRKATPDSRPSNDGGDPREFSEIERITERRVDYRDFPEYDPDSDR